MEGTNFFHGMMLASKDYMTIYMRAGSIPLLISNTSRCMSSSESFLRGLVLLNVHKTKVDVRWIGTFTQLNSTGKRKEKTRKDSDPSSILSDRVSRINH